MGFQLIIQFFMVDNSSSNYQHLFKIVLVGDAGVGKTHLLHRYVKGKLPTNKPSTIGVEFATKNVELRNNQGVVKAQIWDTAGQERYKAITSAHYRRAVGAQYQIFLHLWSMTQQRRTDTIQLTIRISDTLIILNQQNILQIEDTFRNAQRWMEEMRASAEPECVICLVGNQVDRVEINPVLRQVEYETAKRFADANNMKFEETSALTNKAVTDVFDNLLHYIYEVKLAQEGANGIDQLEAESKKYKKLTEFTSPDEERKKSGCC